MYIRFRRRGVRIALACGVGGAIMLAGLNGSTAQAQALPEYAVKAAYLYQFTNFIEWPPSALPSAAVFPLCVLGDDPFGEHLAPLELKGTKDRNFVVQRVKHVQETGGCLIVFISDSEQGKLGQLLPPLRARNVLTVSDAEGFAAAGGIIEFVTQANRVRFMINLDAANKTGLKISSKLLSLATIVGTAPPR